MYQFLTICHESRFKELCIRDGTHIKDDERGALFFLIAGNDFLYNKVDSIYDFAENAIKLEVYDEPYLTGGTRTLIDLAFSLYGCGTCDVRHLFSQLDHENSVLAIEAMKTRFRIPVYTKMRASRIGDGEHQCGDGNLVTALKK